MKRLLRRPTALLTSFGLDPRKFVYSMAGLPHFLRAFVNYRKLAKHSRHAIELGALLPVLTERFEESGTASGHYFHQDLWAARKIFKANPNRHVDIGSSISGFVAHILSFREIEVVDIRPLMSDIRGLRFIQGNATDLGIFSDESLESISSLHAAEHFGLGRYGDPIDPDAHYKFMRSLARVLKPSGRLYFSVPCGKERLMFNAHRILSPHTVLKGFHDLTLLSFSCVKDDGKFYEDCPIETVKQQSYGCGLFEFTKLLLCETRE